MVNSNVVGTVATVVIARELIKRTKRKPKTTCKRKHVKKKPKSKRKKKRK